MNLGENETFEPNQRATTTELFEGLTAFSQNHWPSLNFDIGVINNYLSRFLPAGFITKCSFILAHFGNIFMSRLFGNRPAWAKPLGKRYQ